MDDGFATGFLAGQDSGGGNNGGIFGNEGIWGVVILAMIFGWGRGGFGGGNNGGGDGGGALTRADLCTGFNFNNLDGAVRGVQQGLCDGFYAMNSSLMSGFSGVDKAICTLGYQDQQGFSSLAAQLAACCCDIRQQIGEVKYQMATDTCAIQQTIQNTTRDLNDTIRGGFAAMEARENARYIAELERKLNACDRDNALQGMSTYLINTLRPSPVPSYPSCNPWAYSGGNWSGYNSGCNNNGCNTGCC